MDLSIFSDTWWLKTPRCADRFPDGVRRLPLKQAVNKKHIELNHPWRVDYIAFDIDRPGAVFAYEDAYLPAPTLSMENPKNGHAHFLYQIETPVLVGKNARPGPRRFLNDVSICMTHQLGADPAYIKRFVKTPRHPSWRTVATEKKFTLLELKEYLTVDIGTARAATEKGKLDACTGSRNLTLFDLLRQWAYSSVAMYRKGGGYGPFSNAVEDQAALLCRTTICEFFPHKGILSLREQASIVDQVTRWTWENYTGRGALSDKEFSALQTFRGAYRWKDSSEPKAVAIRTYENGMKIAEIARRLGFHRNTITQWVKSS